MIHAVSLGGVVEGLEVADLVPGERPMVRADFRGDTLALLAVRQGAQRNVYVLLVFGLPAAIDALAGADVGVVGLDQIGLDSDHLALAQLLQRSAVTRLPLMPRGQVGIALKVD